MKNCPYCKMGMSDNLGSCPSCGAPQKTVTLPIAPIIPVVSPSPNKSLFEYNYLWYVYLTVYPNRIHIKDRRGAGWRPKQTDILIKNITGINIRGLTRKLELTMNDGTRREMPYINGKNSMKMREVVLGLL